MNSKQGARYIKRRMGDDLKKQILLRNGILSEESALSQKKPSVLNCHRCSLVNTIDNKFCSRCSYPLTPQAYEEIKMNEDMRFNALQKRIDDLELSNSVNFWGFLLHKGRDMGYTGTDLGAMKSVAEAMK